MLTVDVRDLVGNPGASREIHLEEPVGGLATPLAEVPADRLVEVDVLLESVVEGILVSGSVAGPVRLRCARCLTEFDDQVAVGVRELFASDPGEDSDEYPLAGDEMDLEPMVRDAVVLQLPFSPLCRPDCLGLCERCGGDRNRNECACPPEADPRWAGLEALFDEPDQP
jgi:uncharacterized protein